MSKNNFDKIAAFEKAIKEKYGEEAIANPKSGWSEDKEKDYLNQMKEFYQSLHKNAVGQEKVDVNGIKISKKLLNRESLNNCPVCGSFPKKTQSNASSAPSSSKSTTNGPSPIRPTLNGNARMTD